MTNFWTISQFWIVVLLFISIALAIVLPVLLKRSCPNDRIDRQQANRSIYRDQLLCLQDNLKSGELSEAQYQNVHQEIEQHLTEEAAPAVTGAQHAPRGYRTALLLTGILPAASIALYLTLGNPGAIASAGPHDGQADPVAMVAALEHKLQQNPQDGAGWSMLGRSYEAMGRMDEAVRCFAKAAAAMPEDAQVMADYAEAVALTQNRNLAGKPLELVNRALKLDGKNEKALMLAGVAAAQQKDFTMAAGYWRRLLAVLPPDSELAQQVKVTLGKAEHTANGTSKVAHAAQTGGISGMLSIDRKLAARVSPGDSVFIFARAAHGPAMPLAARKIPADRFPFRFYLSDTDSLSPGDHISEYPEVVVSARISRSGDAMPHSGDLQGQSVPVRPGNKDVALAIDTVVP